MRTRANWVLAAVATGAAVCLTLVQRSPSGLVSVGMAAPEQRAAPGQPLAARYDLSALKVFTLTQTRVSQRYVDPSRINAARMLASALDSVQFNIPEVLVEPDETRHVVTVMVNDKRQEFDTADVDSPWRLSSRLKQIFRFIESNMNPGADLAKVEYAAVNGMLSTLDPHTILMDPEAAKDMDVSTSGKFGGLGIVIRMVDRKLTVIRPMKNTPAWSKGIKAGDHIVKINNELTENLTSNEAVDRMRGEPNTPVTLWIERKNVTGLQRFDLKRAVIRVSQVEHKLLDKKTGYIRVKQFSKGIADDVADAMRDMTAQGANSWILDLRWNGGGLLSEAVKLSDLFVDSGTIVSQVSRAERPSQRAEPGFGDTQSSLAVLVNGSSASASEIVAGALKNLDRAIIIGGRTFGKGSVQELYDYDNGAKLKVTVAQYLTPGDKSIQGVGIVPDIALMRMRVPEKNDGPTDFVRLLPPSKSYGEKDLDHALTSQFAKDIEKPAHEVSFMFEKPKSAAPATPAPAGANVEAEDDEPLDDEVIEDFEMRFARDVVSSTNSATRTGLVKAANAIIAKTRAEEDKKLTAALSKIGVDWSAATGAATTLDVNVTPSSPTVTAGDTVTLTASVRNTGTTAARRVLVRLHTDDYMFDDTELPVGTIAPGETKTFATRIKVPKDALSRFDRFTLEVREAQNAKATTNLPELTITELPRPVFAYSYQLVDEGNGDGLVQQGEKFQLRVAIKNTGSGASEEASAVLRNGSGDGVILDKSRFELGAIAPGQSREITFPLAVTSDLRKDELVLELVAYDATLDASASDKLRFPIRPALVGKAATGNVVVKQKNALVYSGAAHDAPMLGNAERGAGFKLLGTVGEFQKVDIGGGRVGFISTSAVANGSGKPAFIPYWNSTPPAIALTNAALKVATDKFTLRGSITDESHVEDVYVFVSNMNAKIERRKVYYRSNRGNKVSNKLDFGADIPLWPGANTVTIVARENQEVLSTKTINIVRDAAQTAVAAPTANPTQPGATVR